MAKRYRTKLEAEQFINTKEGLADMLRLCPYVSVLSETLLRVRVSNGAFMDVSLGDWVVKQPDGSHFPMADDVFAATYEEVT